MSVVLVYGFTGTFIGKNEYEYSYPNLNDTHQCMLFLFQERDESDIELATNECKKYGFDIISINHGGPLNLEALNTDAYRGFSGFYEEALENGSSLVFSPNKNRG